MLIDVEKITLDMVQEFFPTCNVAILAGSYVRDDFTKASDLDIVIIDESYQVSFRKSFYYKGFPVECFIHNKVTYQEFVKSDMERGRPSLLNMIREGFVLKDDGFAKELKEEIELLYLNGPKMWSKEEIKLKRYMLTDVLDDFQGCKSRKEGVFIAAQLIDQLHEWILRMNGKWIGSGKWVYRALKQYNKSVAEEFYEAMDCYYKKDDNQPLIQLTEFWLNRYGGKLFDGFQLGKVIKK